MVSDNLLANLCSLAIGAIMGWVTRGVDAGWHRRTQLNPSLGLLAGVAVAFGVGLALGWALGLHQLGIAALGIGFALGMSYTRHSDQVREPYT